MEVYQFDTKYAMNIEIRDKSYLRKISLKNPIKCIEMEKEIFF